MLARTPRSMEGDVGPLSNFSGTIARTHHHTERTQNRHKELKSQGARAPEEQVMCDGVFIFSTQEGHGTSILANCRIRVCERDLRKRALWIRAPGSQ